MRFRIIQLGGEFFIQQRILGWWLYLRHTIPSASEQAMVSVKMQFENKQSAIDHVESIKNKEAEKTTVVCEISW